MKFRLKTFGFEALNKKIDSSIANMDNTIQNPLVRIAAKVEAFAKRLCPVDTGRLRSSIGFQVLSPNKVIVATGINPTSRPVNYAAYVEFGTSVQAAQPYMRPAIEAVKPEIAKEVLISFKTTWEAA